MLLRLQHATIRQTFSICSHLQSPRQPCNTTKHQKGPVNYREARCVSFKRKLGLSLNSESLHNMTDMTSGEKNLDDVLWLLHQSSSWKMSVTDFPEHSFLYIYVGGTVLPQQSTFTLIFSFVFFLFVFLIIIVFASNSPAAERQPGIMIVIAVDYPNTCKRAAATL